MKHSRILTIGILVLITLAGILFLAIGVERQVNTSFETEITMQQTLSAIRRLEISVRALRNDPGPLSGLVQNWAAARSDFSDSLERLALLQDQISSQRAVKARLAEIWSRIETLNTEMVSSFSRLRHSRQGEEISQYGLSLHYRRILEQELGDDREAGEVGLLLYNLELTNVLISEVENELREIQTLLRERTVGKLGLFHYAGIAIVTLAMMFMAWLLIRLSRVYSSMHDENLARAAAEASARRSEADLKGILDSIGEAVLAFSPEGYLLRINPAAETLLLWTRAEAVGRPLDALFTLMPAEGHRHQTNPVQAVLRGGPAATSGDLCLLSRRDGSERQVSVLASPLHSEDGRLAGVVVALRDVSDRQRLEEQLRRTQRMESIGQLAGGLAHDFNNFLQIVRANIDLLSQEPTLNEESRDCVGQIDAAARRAGGLTRQLLAFGRRQTLQMHQLNPADLVAHILNLIRRVIGENIEIQFLPEPPLSPVNADAGQLEQVILNLCVNARDAMPTGGRISITLKDVGFTQADLIRHPAARPGAFVLLSISDNGHGMSPELMANIFEPFFTTKMAGQGTGLGLSVVQGIIHQHGGFIEVLSEPGFGTCFSLYLPADARPPQNLPTVAATTGAPFVLGGDKLILLAEDEQPVRKAARHMLTRLGYRVLEACDGEEACRLLEENKNDVSLAMLDAIMPRMGGIDAAQHMRKLRPDLPVLFCSGYTGGIALSKDDRHAGMELLPKPYTANELSECLRRMLT